MQPESLLRKAFVEVIFNEPKLLTSLGLVEQFGITNHNGKLNDASSAHQQALFERWKKDLRQLHEYPLDRQTASQKLSTRILEWYVADQVEGEKWQFHNFPVNQLNGVQNQFPEFMANPHPLRTTQDCEYYLMRLNALATKFDQLLESVRLREQKQILPPRFVVEDVLGEMRNFIAEPAAENILATSFKERATHIPKLTETECANFQNRVERAINDSVSPAHQKLIDYFGGILPKTTTDDGVWRLPAGDGYDAYILRHNTTTTLNPNELHELGLREVGRIEDEMRVLLDANGFAGSQSGLLSAGRDGRKSARNCGSAPNAN